MKVNRKFLRSAERLSLSAIAKDSAAQKIVSAVTAIGFVMQPVAALASTITRADKPNENLANGSVTNIFAETVVGNVAINKFAEFKLDANNIANMYFGKDKDNNKAGNLVNFVNSRIDINGTVNAIQNKKIGGNLFFFSSDGMAVGKSGVINAGALYVATPTENAFKDYKNLKTEDQFKTIIKEEGFANIPINASGTISVLGKVNAVNAVNLRAAKIGVGKNVSENNIGDVAAGATATDASIRTGVVDFKDIVNIGKVKSDLTGNALKATKDGSGDIVLAASNNYNDNYSMLDDFSKIAGAKVEAELSVANGAEVKATGNAKLSAQALNNVVVEKSDQYKENYTPSTTTNSHLYGQIVTTNATVNVDGTVEATQVDITADAVNRYVSAESSVLNASNVTSNIVGALTANLDASYAVLNSKAEVNVGQSAEINATGSDTVSAGKVVKPALNIKANSSVEAGAGASTALLKVMNVAGTNIIPAAAVTYSQTHNEAAVNIDGTLKSTGGTSVTALADSKVNSEAKATTMDVSENPNLGDVALNITTGDNKSSVAIGKTAQMTELQKDVNIEAKSVNSVITKAEVSTGEKAVVATAINVTDYDSKANVNINGNVSSKDGSLSVNAENVLTDNTVIANNAMGSSAFMKKIVTNIKGSQSLDSLIGENGAKDQLLGGIKKWLANAKYTPQKLKDKLNAPSTPSAPTEPKPWDKLADFMSTGVSVGVAVESNTADVKIGQGVALAAKNDLNITAKSVIEDTQMQITGKSNNYDKDTSNKALVNASVLYGKLDNTATVTVAGGEEAQGSAPATNVTLTGGKVNIAANSSFEYNRINRMVQEVKDACAKVKAAYKGENHADIEAKADALSNAADAFFNYAKDNCFSSNGGEQVDFMDLFGGQKYKDFTAACSALTSALGDEAKNIAVGPINVVSAAAAFANPNSYLNFSAGSANGGKSGPGEHEKPATIALAGSAVATDISNNARVLIGKNANIKAGNELAMQAASKQFDVSLAGKLGLNGGGESAVGGTFAVGLADANSLVAVAQGAKLTAGSIDIGTENKIDHIQLSLGAGKGTTSGVSGMVGYLEGASNSLVSVDDEAVINAGTGAVNLNAKNDTNVYSAAGAVAMGETAGIGAAATITNFDRYTYAAIGDNGYTAPPQATTEQGESGSDSGDKLGEDANADRSKEAEKLANTAAEKRATLQQLVQNASGLRQGTDDGKNYTEQADFFGSKTAADTKGSINAGSFKVNAETGGKIINVAVAGGVSTGDDSGEAGIFDKLGNFVSNKTNALTNKLHALDHKVAGKINGLMDRQTEAQKVLPTDQTPKATTPGKQSSVTIAGAGSAAINLLDGDTGALVDNVKINIAKDATNGKTITVTAKDTAMMVAAGGAAGISWKKLTKDNNANSHNAAFGGTVAVNDIDSQTLAVISNSEIENAAAIINNAQKSGSLAAAGLGLALAKNSGGNGGTNIAATVNASINIADNTAYALLQNNKVNNENVSGEDKRATSITNTAFDNDIQITGGVNTSLSIGGDNAFVGGATVAYGSLKNDVQAAILGGTYDKITTADVKATTNMTQVGVAANVSVAGGAKTSYAFSGNSAYNKLDNYANATVEGVTLTGESLNVAAYDTAESANTQAEYLKKRGLDADGSAYLAQVKEAADESGDSDKPTNVDITRGGNVIVTGAVSVGVTTGNDGGSAAASVTVSDIDNDYNAKIKDSNITTTGKANGDKLIGTNVNAASHTVLAGFAAGVAGTAGSFGVGGSANWQSLNNDITAAVENSKLITPKADVKTESGALAVNVAGQIGVTTGKNSKLGAGLAVAYNSLNNTTGAYVKGSEISGAKDANSILTVDAANKGNVYSVGAAVTAGTAEAALNGVVVVNKGKNDVEAVIDKYDDGRTKLNNMSKVAVKSSDDSNQLAVIGNVSVAAGSSAKAAIGGSVAINDIGALAGGKQSNRAAINNADITTAKDGKISVNAVDESTLTTISAGVAITSGNFAFSGGGSAALIEKETKTELKNTNVNADDAAKGDVEASAKGTARITTVGVMGAGAKNAAAGFGIAVNKINADTETEIEGGTYKTDNFIAKSDSVAELTSIGISAAAAKNAGVAGNVTVNLIGNDTATKINNATIIANNNIAALATSSETLHNYAGAMGAALGGQVGIGMSVAYNEITGNTESVVDNSTLNASGKAALGEDVSQKHKDSKGIVVAADAEHELNNVIVTAGLAASSDAAVAVSGTVAVNHLDGETNAKINNTEANTSGTAGDVSVLAKDKTNVISAVGAVSVAGGADVGVGFGAASDTNLLSRNVTAEIDGGNGKKAFYADKLTVDGQSENKTSTTAVGAAVAAAAYGAAGVAGTVSVTKTDAVTLAKVNNITGYNKGTTINAHRSNDITLVGSSLAVAGGMGAGAGGISVGVLSDDSRTEAQLTNAHIKHYANDKAQDIIHADNSTKVTTGIAAASAAIAIGGAAAGSVGVNNFNNTVKTSVANSNIENADVVTADADNHLTTNFVTVSAAGGLVGGSLGVGVNTIDTSVVTEVNNSELYANNVTVAADEIRDITQTAANAAVGGVALGANVLVTNIGSAVQGTYTTSNNDSIDVDGINGKNKHYAMADADDAIGEQNSINSGAYNQFVHKYQSEGSSAVKGLDKAGRGGNAEAKGVQVIVDNGSIVNASNKADIKANTTTNTNITAGGATAGVVSATGTFSILDVKRNSGVAVKNSSISAKEIAIASKQAGTADMNIYQGTGGMVGLNVAVGIAKLNGANKVELDGATLKNADKIEVKAEDESKVNANALGVAVGAVTLGSITAIAENESTNDIVVAKSDVNAATIDITADKRNAVTAHAMGGSAGMANGSAVVANATDNGTSNIMLGKANDTSKNNTITATTLNVNAKASPAVKAVADSVAVALTYGASAAVATATANGGANVTVNNGDELFVDEANLQADIYAQDGMKNAEAKAEGNSGGGLINVGANVATATSNASANVNVGAIKGKTREVVTGKKTVYSNNGTPTVTETKKTVGVTALNISSNNSTTAFADARGVNIGGVFSSGNNVAKTNNTSATNAVLNAGNDELLLGSLNVTASGAGDNLTTADGSGGGLVSADLAAYAENRMNANTTTTVKGKLNVNGEVKINALQNDRANLLADALKATVIGASATEASNEIKGETKVDTDGLTLTGANNLTINANNTVTVGDSEKYAVKGSGYGGVNVQGAVLDNKIDKKAAINLGSAKITTAGAQDYEAETDADVNVGGYIKAAGAGAFTWVDVDNEVKAEDSITVGSGAKLKTTKADKDITLAAVDNMTINVIGVADTQGAAIGGASSDVTNKTTRNNSITVAGNAALYSMNDVNLYAGSDINGAAGKLKLNVDSEAYNKTALGLGKPKLKDDILQNNNVTLQNGSNISSVRNINLYADAGTETIRDTSVMYNWYYSDKDENYTSSTIGDNEPQNKHSNNYIQADGTLTAGVQNKQFITIGKDGSLVFLDSAVRDGVNKVSGNNAIGESELRNQITTSDGINKDDIVIGTMDYGTTLFERYEQVRKLMNEYSEDTTSTAYLGYKAELQRITDELQTMGLGEVRKDSEGKEKFVPIKGATIDYISLPDIVASGGNINITTDTLAGSGKMEAKGAPEVTVTNNTNLYMKINNITVGDAGGEINYNGVGLKSSDYNKTINELNIDKAKSAQFSKVTPTAEAGTGGTITVNGNYGGSLVRAKAKVINDDGTVTEQLIETKPKADIEINGYVNAKKGIVKINSKANNIIIQGASAKSSAGVSGKEVHLTAASGSVSQGYTDGITNIGGSVQTQYNDKYNALKKYFDDKYGYEKTENISGEVTTSTKAKDLTGNMIVGENIYINASDININGYMQSGYADYYVTVDDGIAATINSIKNSYKGGSLSDAVVTTGTKYRVVKGENVWDEATKSYKRQLDVYYNPATGKLVVPDVDVNGGKIYLTGRISSTGGGTIKALDGAYNVAVTNNTANTLQLGRLVSNKSDGLISITDTGRGKLTEITRSGAKEYAISDINKLHGTNVSTSEYNPQTGLRYNWTTGQTVSTSKTYQNTVKAGLWGLVETMDDTKLTEFEQHNKPIKESDSTKNLKPNGEYIGTINNSTVNSSAFSVVYDNKVLNNTKTGPGEPERWSSGFLGWFKWERYTWTRHTGTSQQYVASVKADNPINIGFIGHDNGNINVNSNGSVDIKGKLASTVGGSINLTSNNGSITQNGVNMVSDNVNLIAQTGINNIGITSIGDTVNLSAANNKSGDIDITVAGAYGKAGNVLVGSIVNSGNDEVHLTADGNINQKGNDASIIGKRIDLSSINGAIGSNGTLQIKAGTEVVDATDSLSASINANAKGNINLTQTEGDMRVGQIKSEQGDVTINVTEGNVVDALPDGEIIDRGDTDALIQKWKDLGLISGEGSYTAKQKQDVDEYKQQVTDEFKQYKDLDAYYQDNKLTDAEKAAYESYKNAKASYDALTKEFKDYQNQSIYYTDDKNIPQEAGYKTKADYQKALEAYNTGKTAYAALKDKCEGSVNAEVYARSKMSTESWNTYNAPKIGDKDMKATFGSYDSYQDLQARYSGYADADAYLQSGTAKQHISELTDASRSWTENQLLYAIQDSIINPSSDSGDNISKAPNLIGQSITINAAKGSVGLDSDTVTKIELKGISDRVDDLKKLVNASASTVKWDKNAGIATITPKNPLGMQLASANGKISVNATENVYITNRKDATDNPLNIDTIKTEGNVRLQSNNGIYNLHNGEGAAISGKDLLLQAGTGGVGKSDKLLTINNNGKVTATGTNGVYLEQVGDNALQIVSVAAKGDIVLKAKGDIISADEEDTTAQGYINNESNNGTITIEAGGSAGSAEHKLRIKNADDNHTDKGISVTAGKDVYLQGISTTIAENAEANGTMFINGITAKGIVDVAANGNLNIKGAVNNNASGNVTMTAEKSIAVNAAITNADANLILSARNNVGLDENAVLQAKKVNLVASAVRNLGENTAAGNITQNSNSSIIAENVVASALNGIALSSAKNTLKAIDVANMGKGAINIANDGTHDLTVVIAHKNDGDVTVHNYQNGNITSNMKVESQVEAEGAVNYINDAGSITLPDAATFTSEAEEFGNLKTYDNVIDNVKRTTKAKKVVNIQAKNGDVINSGDIDSDEAVVIKTETGSGNITNTGNIRGTDVSLITENGNIKSDGTLTSTSGDVTANTGKGNIELNADITSAQDVLLTTGDGSIITRGIINANRHVKANATTGFTSENGITAANGDVEIITQTGDINTNGDVTATNGKAVLNSKGGNVNTGNVTANNDVDIDAAQDITANGNLTSTNANVDLQAGGSITTNSTVNALNNVIANANGNINTSGEVTAQNGKAVLHSSAGNVTTKNVTADQAVAIEVAQNITAKGDLKSNHANVNLKANSGSVNTKNVTADQAVAIEAAKDITAKGDVTSTNANVDLKANGGSIKTSGQVNAQKDVDYNAKGSIITEDIINSTAGNIHLQTKADEGDIGNITFGGNVTAEHGNINIDVLQNGSVTDNDNTFTARGDKGDIKSGNFALNIIGKGNVDLHEIYATNNATINVANGNIITDGDITAETGKAVLNSSAGSVTTKKVTAGQAVDIYAAYDITADGNLTSNNGDITLDAGGSITTNSIVNALNNVIANANGNIATNSDVTATNGNAVLNSSTGNVNTQNVTAGQVVDIDAAKDITANGSLTSTNANVELNAGGSITTSGQVKAQQNVDYNAKGSITTEDIINSTAGNIHLQTDAAKGDITFGGDVTAEHGNINIDVLQNANVTDNDKVFKALGDKGDINSGNFALNIIGKGDVDLHEIYATNNALIDVANGNLTLAKIDGNLVALQLKTEGKQLKVDNIIAGTKIIAQGSDIDLNKIKQRVGADGLLTIVPDGAQPDKPIDKLNIGEIITNKGVRFEHLWLNNGSIKVSEGMFHIDKLVVNNVAHFSNKHMKTAVWGAPPQRDGSASAYWNNIAVNNPAQNLKEWQQEGGTNPDKWMYLHFTAQPNVQHSNGALLDLRNYDYVYDQRFTAVDHMLQQLNENKAEEYDINHAPVVAQYFRYDLYDMDEDDSKSEPAKITVEA